jgi:Carboxypeptidase regulatory-like domain
VALLLSFSIRAGELTGTVLTAQGNPKPGVLVEVLGPTKTFTQTDSSGRFHVSLPRGNYVIRVRDSNMTATFPQEVGDEDRTASYKLSW